MSKQTWDAISDAEQHYYEEGYEVVERIDGAVDMSKGDTPEYAARVVIWKSPHNGLIYSEEY